MTMYELTFYTEERDKKKFQEIKMQKKTKKSKLKFTFFWGLMLKPKFDHKKNLNFKSGLGPINAEKQCWGTGTLFQGWWIAFRQRHSGQEHRLSRKTYLKFKFELFYLLAIPLSSWGLQLFNCKVGIIATTNIN